jgi:23S rRNA pseudouridine1911/1915/1917 synthase
MTNNQLSQRQATRQDFTAQGSNVRLDQFLADQPTGLTRSRLHALITEGFVLLNGQSATRPSQKVRQGDRISLTVPPPWELDLAPQSIPLTVVYQDDALIVIDKPAGMSVHPGPGHSDGTLVNALLARCPDIKGIGGAIRPGIVHRLDKDTSGLMVVAKTEEAHQSLSEQFKEHTVTKGYLALVMGIVRPVNGQIDAPIARDPRHRKRMAVVVGGREARSCYRVIKQFAEYSLLEVHPQTGRTHQIRVHLAYLGHPLLGDGVYGKRSPLLHRHFLHAHCLGFQHPTSGEPLEFHSALPDDLGCAVESLRSAGPAR